jgi:hypothetical protein
MVTVGVLPKDPLAVTDEFAVEEEDDEGDDDALDFDEPQPARTTQASRGTAMSARKRRMKTSMVVDVSFASLLARPSDRVRTPATRTGPAGPRRLGVFRRWHAGVIYDSAACCCLQFLQALSVVLSTCSRGWRRSDRLGAASGAIARRA